MRPVLIAITLALIESWDVVPKSFLWKRLPMIIKTIYLLGITLSIAAFAFFYLLPAYRQVKRKREIADRNHDD